MTLRCQLPEQCITFVQMNIILNARIFWRELATWTRAYLFSRYTGIGNAEDVYGHVFTVPAEFSTMLRLIFGGEITENYNQLQAQYLITLRKLIDAQVAGDTNEIINNVNYLYQNTAARAKYMAQVIPFLDEVQWKNMLDLYTYYTIEQANAFSAANYEKNIEVYDQLSAHSEAMGDYFSHAVFNFIIMKPNTSCLENSRLHTNKGCITYGQLSTIYKIRMFWYEMGSWTRWYMLSRFTGTGQANQAYDMLKMVPVEYSNLLKIYFNNELVNENTRLIYKHIDLIDDFITALEAENITETNRTTQLLYQNADQRASVLSKMNPYLNQDEWRSVLYNYVNNTINEATTFLTKEYYKNISIFDRLLDITMRSGDNFSESLFNFISNSL